MHARNCSITLTFDDEHLYQRAIPHSLDKEDWQLFAKRLRKTVGPFRFIMCGEYGEQKARPHYHACLFGIDFTDRVYAGNSPAGLPLYHSETLARVWPFGLARIGDMTFESAAYVARYTVKKVTGVCADAYYNGRQPDFGLQSRRPGIGATWYEKYGKDVARLDEVVTRGRRMRPPRYYFEKLNEEEKRRVKMMRLKRQQEPEFKGMEALERLEVKEECAKAKLKNNSRRTL